MDVAVFVTLLFGFVLSAAGVLGLVWYLQSRQWGEEPALVWWREAVKRGEDRADGDGG